MFLAAAFFAAARKQTRPKVVLNVCLMFSLDRVTSIDGYHKQRPLDLRQSLRPPSCSSAWLICIGDMSRLVGLGKASETAQ